VATRTAKGNLPRVFEVPLNQETLHTTLGMELVDHGDGMVRGRVPVTNKVRQEFGLVHGGVYAAMAEGLCSLGTFFAVQDQGMLVMGQQNDTSFLRPVTEGTVHSECVARHRGRTTWVWDVNHTDDEGRLCAMSRVTIAVRPPRQPAPSAP
jgi:1,4-dihydroxy-2-naphthoyl-CoA hydrolase